MTTVTYAKTYMSMTGERRALRVTVLSVPREVVTVHAGFLSRDAQPVRRRTLLPRVTAWWEGRQLRRDGYTRVP